MVLGGLPREKSHLSPGLPSPGRHWRQVWLVLEDILEVKLVGHLGTSSVGSQPHAWDMQSGALHVLPVSAPAGNPSHADSGRWVQERGGPSPG